MKTKLSMLVVFALGLALAGCKSAEETAKEKAAVDADKAKLQGKWKVASREGSADEDAADPKGDVYVIEGDVLKLELDGQVVQRQKLSFNPLKDPKEVDLVLVNEDGSEIKSTQKVTTKKKGKTKTSTKTTSFRNKGIYSIDGDKLKIAIAHYDQARPKDFTPGPTQRVLNLVKAKGSANDQTPKTKGDKSDMKDEKAPKKDDKAEKKDDKKNKTGDE